MNKRVYLTGRDGIGWAIDEENKSMRRILEALQTPVSSTPWRANVVHAIWWNKLLDKRAFWLRRKPQILASAVNWIDGSTPAFKKASRFVTHWISPSQGQHQLLLDLGMQTSYQPFLVDGSRFCPISLNRSQLAQELGIDPKEVEGRFLVGSFQRDTLGADLKTPKWQKGADRLVDIAKRLPKDGTWALLLAGPRRHYVLEQCRNHSIPYIYVGHEPNAGVDDLRSNQIPITKMPLLYNLADCYVVASRSEGAPKAIGEAAMTRTPIISSRVGMAPDIVPDEALFDQPREASDIIEAALHDDGKELHRLGDLAWRKAHDTLSWRPVVKRWGAFYDRL